MFNFIFVTGAGRCGTNLLSGFIDGNPEVCVLPGEATNYLGLVMCHNGLSKNVNLSATGEYLKKIFTDEYKNDEDYEKIKIRLNKKFEEIKKKNIEVLSANDFLSNICEAIFLKDNGIALINLQNENISGVLEAFSGCKIIHMLRNPLTQINSRYLFRYTNPCNYRTGEFGESFIRNYNSFFQAEIFKNHKQVKIIKMEDLQANTQKILKSVFNFLSIKIIPENFIPSRRGNSFQGTKKGKKITTKEVFLSSGDYSCLSPNDLYFCSKINIAKNFYNIPDFAYAKNSFVFFLFRHLGFVGKNRKKIWNPIRLLKLLIGSIHLFLQDEQYKSLFIDYL